jgi:hypothetical protein
MNNIKIKEILPNILHFSFDNQKDLTLTMFRIQEFYESKYKKIRNKKFTMSEFLDNYMDDSGSIDYFNWYSGFNVPGHVFLKFFSTFKDITPREKFLRKTVLSKINRKKRFYVICSLKGDSHTLKHEVAHSLYYMSESYRRQADWILSNISDGVYRKLSLELSRLDYDKAVIDDEIHAYLTSENKDELHRTLKINYNLIKKHVIAFRKLFKKYGK